MAAGRCVRGHPDLKALNDRWYSLPRWEDMTMEERRQTWGYKSETADAAAGGQPAGEHPGLDAARGEAGI